MKVGDKVKIKSLDWYKENNEYWCTDEMIECKVEEKTSTKFEKIPSGAFAERIYRQQYNNSLI